MSPRGTSPRPSTATDSLFDRCIHHLFEAQVERTPDAIAVVMGGPDQGSGLTYGELDARGDQLARCLRSLGVGPEVIVGVWMERSLDAIVGILGVLKAGGAYLPIDPACPTERVAFMLDDSQAAILLTQEDLLARLSAPSPRTLCLDSEWEAIARSPADDVTSAVKPDDLAYVIYTSGSTGKPKGVLVPHGNVARLFSATAHWYHFDETDVWTLFHSLAFDFSVWEIWGALLHGGRLVIVPYRQTRSPAELYRLLADEGVTVLNQTPSAFNQLMRAEEEAAVRLPLRLRHIIFGGEALEVQRLRPWFARHGDQRPRLVNMYGITETTVHVTYRPLALADLDVSGSLIGRPIPDLELHILDQHGRPAPIGVPGEIHVGGAGVARGYLNRPDLTSARFVENPFGEGRLYRSGDLARRLPNGDIEYRGRIDHQVKIRGFRVELGEIEAALAEYPEVREAVVVSEDRSGDKRLLAYLVPRLPGVVTEEAMISRVRRHLCEKLSDYMIPSAFALLGSLPLTPNGKVDRRALPAPAARSSAQLSDFEPPRTSTEKAIARIWSDVLNVERVSLRDEFFELGGDSLLATQVASHVRTELGLALPFGIFFTNSTVAALAGSIDALDAAHATMDDHHAALARGTDGSIPKASRSGELPLSFAQQRLWFLDQLGAGAAYNVFYALRLTGDLAVAALRSALRTIVLRHESLRTTFAVAEGRAHQVIHTEATLDMPLIDLGHLSSERHQDVEVERLSRAMANRPFDLRRDPMLRAALLRLEPGGHVLLLTVHHIAVDGWSIRVLWRELMTLYAAFSQGEPSPLPAMPIQFADFAVWQRSWLTGSVLDAQLCYWKARLAGAPELLRLPTDRARPPVQTYRGGRIQFRIDAERTEHLRRLGRQADATLFMTLLSAFQVLLSRHSGQEDVVVGVPIANRNRQELEPLIGFFVNTLPLRADLSGDPTFLELLDQVRQATQDAYTHQDLPFERLVEELSPERTLDHSPLVQVALAWQGASTDDLTLPGLHVRPLPLDTRHVHVDMEVHLWERGDELFGDWIYSTDLFDVDTITRMIDHLHTLLAGIVDNPGERVGRLPMLTDVERRRILVEWNDTAAAYRYDVCIHQLFEAQVTRTPDAKAVVFDDGTQDVTLSYRELNERANQLAHHLRSFGVGPEVLVGICVERSPDMVVGVLGILKAGGAYLPLDPAYPAARLAFMLTDAGPPVLLTQARLAPELSGRGARIVCLDRDWPAIAASNQANPSREVKAENLAYVIYTSGSTGNPKGVLIEHRGLRNVVEAQARLLELTPVDRVLQFASLGFDAATSELWMALSSGAALCLAARETLLPGEPLQRFLARHRITIVTLTPSALAVVPIAALPDLHTIIVAGEACSAELVRSWSQGRRFFNLYGPTEATICATAMWCTEPSEEPPIGRPIANTQVYILDRYNNPTPVGVPGELCIGGAGVARGYLNRPALTQEKFMASPFGDGKLYKTGDLARYREGGNIEFLGRIDQQVKLRGFRIELGEIEAALSDHPLVREVVVIVREDQPGSPKLVSYVVPEAGDEVRQAEHIEPSLRRFLQTRLPEYMVPSALVVLEVLPLTPNGKVDRKALPAPGASRHQRSLDVVSPRTPTEAAVARAWQEVLGLGAVDVHDDFFVLGGHSLLVTQVVARLRDALQVEVPLRALFQAPTIAQLADHIETLKLTHDMRRSSQASPEGREEIAL